MALLWTVSLTVAQLGSLGLPLAATYEIAAGRETSTSFLARFGRYIWWSLGGSLTAYVVLLVVVADLAGIPASATVVAAMVLPSLLGTMLALAFLQAAGGTGAFNRARLLPPAFYAAALLPFAAAGHATLTTITAAWVGSNVASALIIVWSARRNTLGGPEARHAPRAPSDVFRFGLRGLFGSVSPTETFRIDQLLVGLVLSSHALGIYVAALAFTNLPRFFAQSIGMVAFPAVAHAPRPQQLRTLTNYTAVATVVVCGTSAVLAALAGPLVSVAFGDPFRSAAEPLRLLLVATVLIGVRRVLSDALRGLGHPGAGSRAEALSWVVLVPAIPVMAATMELTGIAIALIAAYAVSLAYLFAYTVRSSQGETAARTV